MPKSRPRVGAQPVLSSRRMRAPTLIAVSPRVRWAAVIIGLIGLVLLIRAAPSILTIGLGGFTLALILSFPVNLLSRWIPRGFAIGATFLGLIGLITLALVAIIPTLIDQLTALISATPTLAKETNQLLINFLQPFQERGWLSGTPEGLINQAQQELMHPRGTYCVRVRCGS